MSKYDIRNRADTMQNVHAYITGPWIHQQRREREAVASWRRRVGRVPALVREMAKVRSQ